MYGWRTAHGLQDDPCTLDIGLEGGERRAVGDPHDSLRSQVEDRLHLVLVQRPLQRGIVRHVAVHDANVTDCARADEMGLWDLITDQTHHLCSSPHQSLGKPGAQ